MNLINPTLLKLAEWREAGVMEKSAFVPQGATDPGAAAAGGGGDPAAGAMPPGGAPPGGGMPPGGDPSMGGGMPPAGGGGAAGALPPELMAAVQAAVQQAMSTMNPAGAAGGAPGAPGAPGAAGPGKGAKIDPGMIYMELGRIRKMMTTMFQNLEWDLPPDILDDQMVAQSVAGMGPTSAPTNAAPTSPPTGGAGAGQPPGLPGIGQSAAINPISPAGAGGGGGGKTASLRDMFMGREVEQQDFEAAGDRLEALAHMARSLNSSAA